MSMIKSPITGGQAIALERRIPSRYIIESYLESYGIDVTALFRKKEEVEVYRCEESGFRFFGPDHLAGDSDFYARLQEFPWYYMDWKWEHEVTEKSLPKECKLLEIGCAEGAFLQRLGEGVSTVGLELNTKAAKGGQAKGLDIRTETIQDHADANEGMYDVVCSFQVMEHVTDVRGIVSASIKALKTGGRLLISVPNNDSFIKHSPNSILNMPPHHMCLWDESSLRGLENYFDMKFSHFEREPLQAYHYPVVTNNWIEKNIGKGLAGKGVKKLVKWTRAYKAVGLFKDRIVGHSIIAHYIKR